MLVNKTRSERDRCLGSSDELIRINQALNVKLADYERIVANNESLKRKRWHFYVAGVATPVVLAGLSILIYMAAF